MASMIDDEVGKALYTAVGVLCLCGLAASAGPGPPVSAFEAEAQKVADQFWADALTTCGDSRYYVERGNQNNYGIIHQMKGTFAFSRARSDKALSPADRANGIEWQGSAFLNVQGIVRFGFFGRVSYAWEAERTGIASWGEWSDAVGGLGRLTLKLVKKDRNWMAVPYPTGSPASFTKRKLSCDAVAAPVPSVSVNEGLFVTPETDPFLINAK